MRELSAEEKAELYEACLPGGALQGAHARRASAMAAGRARAAAVLAEASAAEAALAAAGAHPYQVRHEGLSRPPYPDLAPALTLILTLILNRHPHPSPGPDPDPNPNPNPNQERRGGHEEDADDAEADRRVAWIRYHLKLGNYDEATELGWDGDP